MIIAAHPRLQCIMDYTGNASNSVAQCIMTHSSARKGVRWSTTAGIGTLVKSKTKWNRQDSLLNSGFKIKIEILILKQ